MFKKFFLIFALGLLSLSSVLIPAVSAVTGDSVQLGEAVGRRPLEAIITAPTAVEAGRLVVFDGTRSHNPNPPDSLRFYWEFGDDTASIAAEVGHKFEAPGRYQVRLTVANQSGKTFTEHTIVVFQNRAFIISDGTADPRVLNTFQTEADSAKVLLDEARTNTTGTDFSAERLLIDLMKKRQVALSDSPLLIFWTDNERGLTALTSFAQENPSISFANKTILIITNSSPAALTPFGKIAFRVLQPHEIIISSPDAVYTSLLTRRIDLAPALSKAEKDFVLVDQAAISFKGYNLMSQGVVYLLANGVPQRSLTLLLMLPLVATIAVITKQILGLNLMGIFVPSIITLALIAIGFWQGLLILTTIITASILFKKFSKNWRLMYYPKMAFTSIIITLAIISLLGIATLFGANTLTSISIFPLLVMILIAEKFASVSLGSGFIGALKAFGGTIFVAGISYVLVEQIAFFKTLFLIHPEIILLLLLINWSIGQWRGLRLTEQWRFWDLRHYEEEE